MIKVEGVWVGSINREQLAAEESAPGPENETATETDADAELEQLQAEAEVAGVKVDGRWGVDRLREEIDAAADENEEG